MPNPLGVWWPPHFFGLENNFETKNHFNALIDMGILNKEHVYDRVNWDIILYNNVCTRCPTKNVL